MEDRSEARAIRYVALDMHKKYCVIAGVDREGRVVLQPVGVEHGDLEEWLKKNLRSTDRVVIESTTNAWHVYDLLKPLAEGQALIQSRAVPIATGDGEPGVH